MTWWSLFIQTLPSCYTTSWDSTSVVQWSVGDIAAGATVTVQFTADVIATTPAGTEIFNFATITSDNLFDIQTNTTVHTVAATPAIEVVKVADPLTIDPALLTSTIDYSYTVTNAGSVPLTNVSLVDDVEGPSPSRASRTRTGTYRSTTWRWVPQPQGP